MVRLPHGETAKVEVVYDDGDVQLRRLEGEWAGRIALCRVSKLLPVSDDMHVPDR